MNHTIPNWVKHVEGVFIDEPIENGVILFGDRELLEDTVISWAQSNSNIEALISNRPVTEPAQYSGKHRARVYQNPVLRRAT